MLRHLGALLLQAHVRPRGACSLTPSVPPNTTAPAAHSAKVPIQSNALVRHKLVFLRSVQILTYSSVHCSHSSNHKHAVAITPWPLLIHPSDINHHFDAAACEGPLTFKIQQI